jgi:hypothetical protein
MPNHVTNILIISGDDELIKRIREGIRGDDDEDVRLIDFNRIIPCPESLNITSGSLVDNGLAVLQHLEGNSKEINKMLSWVWVREKGIDNAEDLVKYMLENKTADIESAKIALENIENYGHKDWYSWAIDKWGTKWNAYTQKMNDDGSITFQTAWSNPYPVIQALSEKYPDARFHLKFADEDLGHNVGEYTMVDGLIIDEYIPDDGSEEALLMAIEICEYDDYISDRCFEIDPDYSVDDLEGYDMKWLNIAYNKGILDRYPKCALDYLLQLSIDDENYEFAQKIKETTSWHEV